MISISRGLVTSGLSLSLAVVFASSAVASDHVVTGGQSIQTAIDGASDGDRVLVHEGLYLEALDLRGKQLEVIAVAGAEYTVLDATMFDAPAVRAASGEGLGTSLYGFAIRGGAGEVHADLGASLTCGGGVLVSGDSSLKLERCVIAGNGHATVDIGGGIYAHGAGSRVDIVNCVIHTNGARLSGGGAAAIGGAHLQVESSTFVNNYTAVSGGGVSGLISGPGATTDIHESIIWGNEGVNLGAPTWLGVGTITATYSDIGGGWVGVGNQDVDPIFQDLPGQDFRLVDGSPCVDAGDPQSAPDIDGSFSDQGAGVDYSMGGGDFTVFCDAKINSAGCQADIFWTGTPTLTGPDDFHLGCNELVNANFGVLIWGDTEASIPYMNATLCVQPPLIRKRLQFTAGNGSGIVDCSGNLHSGFSQAYMNGRLLFAGTRVSVQYWYRDPENIDGTGVALSDAVSFTVIP
jgi:hypothetical protein